MDSLHSKWRKKRARGQKASRTAGAVAARKGSGRKRVFPEKNKEAASTPKRTRREIQEASPSASGTTDPVPEGSRTLSSSTSQPPSASRRKLEMFQELLPLSALSEKETKNLEGKYIIIDRIVFRRILSAVKCKDCGHDSRNINFEESKGFAEKIAITCEDCKLNIVEEWSSDRLKSVESTRPPFAINRAMTEAFLAVGLGHNGMLTFSSALGINPMSHQSFDTHLKALSQNLQDFKNEVLSEARRLTRELYELEDPSLKVQELIDIAVSYDGSWQKRGFTSLYGLAFVIDLKSGLVIDYEILSKYCYSCLLAEKSLGEDSEEYIKWFEEHTQSGTCNRNYKGSSPAMEMEGAVRLWQRSMKECNFRYTNILSDGDAKTYSHLENIAPYGPDHKLEKEECLNHVAKRLYTNLKKVISDCRVKKITLGGRGSGQLTEKVIGKLSNYYRLAIENNIDSVKNMQKAILATIYHYSSTDQKPNHKFCPTGSDTWCFYNKAKALKQKPASHSKMSTHINETVIKHILPVYKRLSHEELLTRCQRGGTQNNNECLHSVVWHKVPKEVFVSKARLEIGVVHAVAEFNMGKQVSSHLEHKVHHKEVPAVTEHIKKKQDKLRVKKSETGLSRFQRKKRRKERAEKEAKEISKEGISYTAGGF